MKVNLFITCFFLVSCSLPATSPDQLTPGVVDFSAPKSDVFMLDSGLTVIFKESTEVPLVQGALYFPKGRAAGHCGMPGLGSMTLSQMREGGTLSMKPEALDSYLDSRAASIEASFAEDYSSIGFSTLSEDFDLVFKHFSDVVFAPGFDESRLKLAKKLTADSILRRKDNPDAVASLTMSYAWYGEGSPWYMPVTSDSVSELQRRDLQRYHAYLMDFDGAYLVISGDISSAKIKHLLRSSKFNTLSSQQSMCEMPNFPDSHPENQFLKGAVVVVNKPLQQSSIRIGHLHPQVDLDGVYSSALFNRVFSSGAFDTVLFEEIRTKRGLAYTVSGGVHSSKKRGSVQFALATAKSNTLKAVRAMFEVLKKYQKEGFSEEKVRSVSNAMQKAFVFKFENPETAISRPALLDLYGYPKDYDEEYNSRLRSIEAEELSEFMNREIQMEELLTVIVGDVSLDQGLELARSIGLKRACLVEFGVLPDLSECRDVK